MTEDHWVPATFAADKAGRPYRTIQTWARRGHIPSRTTKAGVLEVHLYATIRHSTTRAVLDEKHNTVNP